MRRFQINGSPLGVEGRRVSTVRLAFAALKTPERKTMKIKTDVHSGFVVIAIIAVLIGMLVLAVQKVR